YNNLKNVPAGVVIKGEAWNFTVQPCDTTAPTPLCGPTQTAPAVTVQNTAPTAASPAISPASPFKTSTLTATFTYSDVDGDLESGTAIHWFMNGVEQVAYQNQ